MPSVSVQKILRAARHARMADLHLVKFDEMGLVAPPNSEPHPSELAAVDRLLELGYSPERARRACVPYRAPSPTQRPQRVAFRPERVFVSQRIEDVGPAQPWIINDIVISNRSQIPRPARTRVGRALQWFGRVLARAARPFRRFRRQPPTRLIGGGMMMQFTLDDAASSAANRITGVSMEGDQS